jgi:hypothetical protein
MSARTFSTLTVVGFAAIPFVACGGDDGHKVDSGIVVHDSNGSGSGSGSNRVCSVMATYSPTFTTNNSGAIAGGSDVMGFPYHDRFLGLLGATQTEPILVIDIAGGAGSNSPDWPTDLGAKSGVNLAMAQDAGAAIVANISGSGVPQDIYAATAGTLNVTMAANGSGGTFAGNLSNVTFTHVNFGSDGTFIPDPDGCTSTIANASFSATLQAPHFNGKTVVVLRPTLFHRYQ